jgi:FAD/FMN-containing dehydrogenase
MGSLNVSADLPIIWRKSTDLDQYEEARVGRVFNQRRPERYPIAIVKAQNEAHIIEAVRLANDLKCRISVRSGGHSWAAWSVRDDAILIDLGKWNHMSLDSSAGIVSCSPSTTGRMVNEYLSELGYMFPGGHCPDVGLGGFLLQGGMGWNCKVSRISASQLLS